MSCIWRSATRRGICVSGFGSLIRAAIPKCTRTSTARSCESSVRTAWKFHSRSTICTYARRFRYRFRLRRSCRGPDNAAPWQGQEDNFASAPRDINTIIGKNCFIPRSWPKNIGSLTTRNILTRSRSTTPSTGCLPRKCSMPGANKLRRDFAMC